MVFSLGRDGRILIALLAQMVLLKTKNGAQKF
jgi:hypothetical protein